MLSPKKTKHRKWHLTAGTSGGRLASRTNKVSFGEYGLKATTESRITSRQIEAARRVVVRYTRKSGKMWIRIFPDKPITMHSSEQKMGKGKGALDHYVINIKPGTVVLEVGGIPESDAIKALSLAGYKLPVKTKVVTK
ncbi:MAG: 50S ribosomal protein L16 [Patescibacteria group bacterium]